MLKNPESTPSPAGPRPRPRAAFSTQLCAGLLLCFAIYYARSLLIPIVLALFAYLTLRPVLRFLRRRGLPHTIGACIITGTLLLGLGVSVFTVYQPAKKMFASGPEYVVTIKSKLDFVFDKVSAVNEATDKISSMGEEPEEASNDAPVPVEVRQPAWSNNMFLLSGTSSLISAVTVVGVLLFFLLSTGDQVLASVLRTLPSFSARLEFMTILERIEDGLSRYLGQVTAINLGLGVAVALAMWALGMPSPIMWGAMATVLNFVPVLGAVIGSVTVFLAAVVSFESSTWPFLVGTVFLLLTAIEGQFITPSIVGRSMNLSPVMVMLSLLFWGWMWGIVGVFLAVPMLIVARLVLETIQAHAPEAAIDGFHEARPAARQSPEPATAKTGSNSQSPKTAEPELVAETAA
ncbi:AI-2E family transporter [Fuerstiella marisgermanici]|uniref:Transport of quorum-sensing signal protein n=1 Tax=Fuerstiella marisgermanici TaxID=1891926 RepID=A0A1P8WMF6_9PLAN|nr:AI-2E family transporter [Fuerstiella marisgermanici]APZ95234.1 Transport of quorum-sensing signal protein [Fuerstiella marisgermanici]